MKSPNANILGAMALTLGMLIFSLQDIAIKWIGGEYPVIEIVIIRSLVALPCTLFLLRYEGQRGQPQTKQPLRQYMRGFWLFLSYTTYVMGLAALPLADIAAIRNSAPLIITLLSVVLLGERVGPRRWIVLLAGFLGVLLIVQPGSASFNFGSLFALLATLFYAFGVMLTRRLQTTDSSATMAYYSSLVYLVASFTIAPIALLIGEQPDAHPSIVFLLRPWVIPTLLDGAIMASLGLVWAGGMYSVARAYSMAEASAMAPFEYTPLLINLIWGLLLWHEVPTMLTIVGALLTMLSGMYILYRERKLARRAH
jgi:drug/metabolite transporter (DMT)-like permease